jgi:hypothetical protein
MSATPATETSLAVFLERAADIARRVGVSQLINESRALLVQDDESFGAAGGFRAALKGAQKKAEDGFEEVKKPLREAKAAFDRMEHAVVDPIKGAVVDLDGRITSYRQEQQRLSDEKRRLDEAAARKVEENRRLLEAEAAVANGVSEDEALSVLDEPLAPVLAPVEPLVPRVAGQSFVKTYSAEVFDLGLLQGHVAAHPEDSNLTMANMPALNQRAKAGGGRLAIPGVRVVAKETVRGRAAG